MMDEKLRDGDVKTDGVFVRHWCVWCGEGMLIVWPYVSCCYLRSRRAL